MSDSSRPRFPFARRVSRVVPSGIRKIFNLAATLRDPIDLSIGQPDFDVPEEVKEAAIAAIRNGHNKYTLTTGLPELNEKLLAHVERRKGRRFPSCMVTSGVSGGLLLSFLGFVEEGVEVLVPDPYFISYPNLVGLCGGEPRYYSLYPDFRLTLASLQAAVTPRTRLLVLNSPSNPTGAVWTRDDLRVVADFSRQHRLLVLSDEIYDYFHFHPGECPSIARYYEDTILLGGLSKSGGMPGWRIGYLMASREIVELLGTLQQFSYVCAPTPAQKASLAMLDYDFSRFHDTYRRKRDLVVAGLRGIYDLVVPEGSFYAFPRTPWGTSTEFVEACGKHNLLVVPGAACSRQDTHFRLSFAAPDETLRKGIEILRRLAAGPAT